MYQTQVDAQRILTGLACFVHHHLPLTDTFDYWPVSDLITNYPSSGRVNLILCTGSMLEITDGVWLFSTDIIVERMCFDDPYQQRTTFTHSIIYDTTHKAT